MQAETNARVAETGDLFGQYTVKVDLNGYVSGFGLASTAIDAVPSSEFIVRADAFAIASPSGPAVPPAEPFIVRTTPTTINGVSVPVGVYMTDTFIQNGTITTAKIGDLAVDTAKIADAAITNLKVNDLNGQKIDAGSITADKLAAGTITANELAAGTIDATRLQIGLRGAQSYGITFSADPDTDTVSWTSGNIRFLETNGTNGNQFIQPGSAVWTTGVLYMYWDGATNVLSTSTSHLTVSNSDNLLLAKYEGGVLLQTDMGRTIVDGANIRTGSIVADQIAANAITSGKIAASEVKADKIDVNGTILFNDGGTLTIKDGGVDTPQIALNGATNGATIAYQSGTSISGSVNFTGIGAQAVLIVHYSIASQDDEGANSSTITVTLNAVTVFTLTLPEGQQSAEGRVVSVDTTTGTNTLSYTASSTNLTVSASLAISELRR